jgi:hypothetical protein
MWKRLQVFLVCLLLSVFATSSVGEILDPNGPRNEVLARLAGSLDHEGIDVRFGSNAGTPVPGRPQLTPLASFETAARLNLQDSVFVELFAQGIAFESALFAVDTETGEMQSDPRLFFSRWAGVPRDRRVFVSFASADAVSANRVATALNSSGFSTFIYIGRDAAGAFNAVDTGNYFREAGHRFVIDTESARRSAAVAAEALFARDPALMVRDVRPGPPPVADPSDFGCCRLCTLLNGRPVNCGETMCGARCRGAR